MRARLHLDDRLIEQARKIGRHCTKTGAVHAALREYLKHHEQIRIVEMFGTVDFEPGWDPKAARRTHPA